MCTYIVSVAVCVCTYIVTVAVYVCVYIVTVSVYVCIQYIHSFCRCICMHLYIYCFCSSTCMCVCVIPAQRERKIEHIPDGREWVVNTCSIQGYCRCCLQRTYNILHTQFAGNHLDIPFPTLLDSPASYVVMCNNEWWTYIHLLKLIQNVKLPSNARHLLMFYNVICWSMHGIHGNVLYHCFLRKLLLLFYYFCEGLKGSKGPLCEQDDFLCFHRQQANNSSFRIYIFGSLSRKVLKCLWHMPNLSVHKRDFSEKTLEFFFIIICINLYIVGKKYPARINVFKYRRW